MPQSLKGQFLVAMPGMQDERFVDSVIYLVGHGEEGAMGIIVNQQVDDMRFTDVLEELELGDPGEIIRLPDAVRDRKVLRGGPVEVGRGFVLHSSDYQGAPNSYEVNDEVSLSASLEVLRAIAFGDGPERALFALGYCGWGPGQLEDEIRANGWLNVPHSSELLFRVPISNRYDEALAGLGINRASLSSQAGTA